MTARDVQPVTEGCVHMILVSINIYILAVTGILILPQNRRYPAILQVEYTKAVWTPERNRMS